jgi:DNA uptake protein ComE-like DNA-binding protein
MLIRKIRFCLPVWFLVISSLFHAPAGATPSPWVRLDGVKYLPSDYNDGDSFRVWHSGKEYVFRLYGVDAPETSMDFPDRVEEQSAEFGASVHATLAGGRSAADLTEQFLRNGNFSLITSGEDALGRSRGGRIYAYVILPSNRDLGAELLSRGLARAHGKTPSSPHQPYSEVKAHYEKLEQSARTLRRGLWGSPITSGSSGIYASPATRPTEEKTTSISNSPSSKRVNINRASPAELESLPGIGPVLASRIIASRPYSSEQDLLKVEGIGQARLMSLRPLVEYRP